MQIGGMYTIDFAKVSKIPKFEVTIKSGDSKRTIKLILLKNSEVLNLNNYTVVVAAKKSDGTDIFNNVKTIDAESGICEIEISEQMLALEMDLPCEIVLYDANGVVASSSNFIISKISSLKNEETILSSNEFTALTKALSDVTYVKSTLDNKANKDEIFSMSNMGQDIKEAMTGGSVAVVGKNSVLNENISDKQVTVNKTDFIHVDTSINKFNGVYIKGLIINGSSSSSTNVQYRPEKNLNTGFIINVDPNTTYTINIDQISDILKIVGFNTIKNIDDFGEMAITPDFSIRFGVTNKFTFTTSDSAKTIAIAMSSKGDTPYCEVVKGDKTGFYKNFYETIIPTLNCYTKSQVNELINFKNEDIYVSYNSIEQRFKILTKSGVKDKFICYNFKRSIRSQKNADIWRMDNVDIATYINGDFTDDNTQIVWSGEFDIAIMEKNASDFIGGYAHGYENFTSFIALADGEKLDLSSNFLIRCTELELFVNSDLDRNGFAGDKVATHYKHFIFNRDGFTRDQKLTFLQPMTMDSSYLAMLPMTRNLGEVYVSRKGLKDNGKIYDLSNYQTINTERTEGCKYAVLYNDTNGYKVKGKIEILDSNWLPNNSIWFVNSQTYNKVYCDYCGSDYVTKVGEVWNMKTSYSFKFNGLI